MQPLTSDTIDLLARLVAFDTTSRNSNLPLVEWLCAFLAERDVPFELFPSEDGRKASVYATIGPADAAGYVLSGHTDVVPVDGQAWSSDPFRLRLADGKAYGRGACDMKGFLACMLAMVPAMQAARLKRPVHLAFSYDEEVGCTGVRPMLHEIAPRAVKPLAAFIGEPSSMQVIIGHKSGQRCFVKVTGRAAHSSLAPHGVNAVEWGARLVAHIRDMADDLAANGARDALYDVPHTTMHVGIFKGGTAPNIVPHEAEISFECRALGGEDADAYITEAIRYAREELEPKMKRIDPSAGFEFAHAAGIPALDTAPDHAAVTLAKRLAGQNGHAKVAYGTEAGLFQEIAGVPSIVIGPGDIDQAHKPDEWIAVSELDKCNAFIGKLIAECAA
jgi:acetylornithine deacetylase